MNVTQVTYSPALDGPSNAPPQGVHPNSQIAQNGEGVLTVLWFRIELDAIVWGYLSFKYLHFDVTQELNVQ